MNDDIIIEPLQGEIPAEAVEPVETAPEVVEETPVDPVPEPEQDELELEADEEPETPKKKSGVQRLKEQRDREREQRIRLEAELEVLRRPQPEKQAIQEAEPNLDTWEGTIGEYMEARSKWERTQVLREIESRQMAERAERQRLESLNNWQKKLDEARTKHPEWDKVASATTAEFSPQLLYALQGLDDGPEVMLHLAKNPSKCDRINQAAVSNPAQMIYELGRVSAALNQPKATPSKAPAPVSPVKPQAIPSRDNKPGYEIY
jgi:hypothetical protein